MNLEIKKAVLDNLADIQKLNLMLFEKEIKEYDNTLDIKWPYSAEGENYFREKVEDKDGCAFIACDNNKVIGYLAGGMANKTNCRIIENLAELENMFVLAEYRGQKVGKKLYEVFIGWCKKRKIKRIRVVASASNISN